MGRKYEKSENRYTELRLRTEKIKVYQKMIDKLQKKPKKEKK